MTEKKAAAGTVTTHDTTMRRMVAMLILAQPSTSAAPEIAPMTTCVVDSVSPSCDAVSTVNADANCAA